jgi:signal transduction histidine kinase
LSPRRKIRTAPAAGTATRPERAELAQIARAKLEWERSVDAVPELICLLDRGRRVVRINRTVERWGLGPLRSALGMSLHRFMHPGCSGRGCKLARGLTELWAQLATGCSASVILEDPRLGRVLSVEAQSLGVADAGLRLSPKCYALLVAKDVTELTQVQKDLRLLNEQLEFRVRERTEELERTNGELRLEITRRELAESALRVSRNELSQLSHQLMRAQELERKRIAQELHDSVGQSLTAIKYTLEHTVQLASRPGLGNATETLAKAVGQVQRVIGEVRAISTHLRPTVLDHLGVASAIRGFCREWAEIYQNVTLTLDIAVEDPDVPEELCTPVFRAVQEALNNVAKHASASKARVSLLRRRELLVVEISDNGRGMPRSGAPGARQGGFGVSGLRERAAHSGGQLRISSGAGSGTTLQLSWPVAHDLHDREDAACA